MTSERVWSVCLPLQNEVTLSEVTNAKKVARGVGHFHGIRSPRFQAMSRAISGPTGVSSKKSLLVA